MTEQANTEKIDKLLDAIEFAKADDRETARKLLRELIQQDSDFEDAWLWMSVVVDSLDQSTVCLDNVLRVNPQNAQAAGALYRLRENEIRMEKRRSRLRFYRDFSLSMMWLFTIALLYAMLFSFIS